MIAAVADTHGLIWYIWSDPRMSKAARTVFDDAAASGDRIVVSSISLIEIIYLIEKRRIDPLAYQQLVALLNLGRLLTEIVVDRDIADALATIPRDQVPDMPDRIIAATALHLNVPLIRRDRKIQASSVQTIW
jgi:PIN domain nuclease of toxin-antitoxin system